jgi:hypothetical protein
METACLERRNEGMMRIFSWLASLPPFEVPGFTASLVFCQDAHAYFACSASMRREHVYPAHTVGIYRADHPTTNEVLYLLRCLPRGTERASYSFSEGRITKRFLFASV